MQQNEKYDNLNQLCNLLNFGADCLQKANIDYKKIKVRKRLFLQMVVAAHNYTESIFSLCKENRTHVCFVLLRSLVENRINAKSLFACEGMDGVYLFQIDGYEEQKKMLERLLVLNKTIPTHQLQFKISDEDIRKSMKTIEKNIKHVERKTKNKTGPKDLFNLCLAIDKFNINKNKPSASLLSEYESIFRHLCSHSHLTIKGLDEFISTKQGILEFFLSGNPEDRGVIVAHSLYLYQDILKMFLIQFKIPLLKSLKNLSS